MSSLRNQILALVVGLVALTSITVLTLFWYNTSEFTRTSVAREFANATQSFQQLLQTREDTLVNSAALLTADFGFKQAVASRDEPTIASVLLNHGQRVEADMMFVTDLRGQLISTTHPALKPGTPLPFPFVLVEAAANSAAIAMIDFEGRLYQIAVLPIRAPRPIAFAAVGFLFDKKVAEELKGLTELDVTIQINRDGRRIVSTLDPTDMAEAIAAPSDVDPLFGLPFATPSRFVSQSQPLTATLDEVGEIILSATLSEEFNAFTRLRDEVFLAFLAVLSLAVFGASLFSRNLTEPLDRLVETARRMARGNYDAELGEHRPSSEVGALFQAFRDMGHDIKQREELIRWQAEHDDLTGLLTRQKAVERIASEVLELQQPAAVLTFSIDGLREIGDALGPGIADEYIRILGERLRNSKIALLSARLATNEFAQVVLLQPGQSPEAVCQQTLDTLQGPIQIQDIALRRTIRAGYALAPQHSESAEIILKRASIAVERARQEQAVIRAYNIGEDEEQVKRLRIINELKSALTANDGQLFMVYQPKMSLKTGRVDRLESLMRWKHPELGFVSPELFISLAEQSNLILDLTDWVISAVIQDRQAWQPAFPDLQVAINVSAQDLAQETLIPSIIKKLGEANLEPAALCFEMTERDVMNDADKTASILKQLREIGFHISVDDYGIGQSSLSKLKHLPVDEIKIDKLFIMTLDESAGDRIIVESTIELGHRFGLIVIAEGVETASSVEILDGFGCDYVQGYHLCKPIPANDLTEWLTNFEDERRAASQ